MRAACVVAPRGLPIRLSLDGRLLLVRVSDRGARYAVRIDPFFQPGPKLSGGGEAGAGWFGAQVAISATGNTALIGGPADNAGAGAAWVFAAARTDPFGDSFGSTPRFTAHWSPPRATRGRRRGSSTFPYGPGQPPHHRAGLLWIDYFGIPFAISPPITLPDTGHSALGGSMPLGFSAAQLPWHSTTSTRCWGTLPGSSARSAPRPIASPA